MKNDRLRYILLSVSAFILLMAAFVVVFWVFDNVFNGVLKDWLAGFLFQTEYGFVFDGSRLRSLAVACGFLFSALLCATGGACAYKVYKKQHALVTRAREEARRAQTLADLEMQRKSDLITYLAHDLKTPLASVIAYLSLLSEAPELSSEQKAKYTGIALDKAYRLDKLIGELFEIIRFNLQTISLNIEPINLSVMLRQLADEFYPILLPRGQTIRVDCEDGFTLRGDADKLARVFNNILKNAAAYGQSDSEIRVTAKKRVDYARLEFINSGEPIPAEKQKLLFEKFYRLDSARSTQTGGAGLGLAIAREIVEAHGGEISIQSDDTQTAFIVDLPARARKDDGKRTETDHGA